MYLNYREFPGFKRTEFLGAAFITRFRRMASGHGYIYKYIIIYIYNQSRMYKTIKVAQSRQ